MKRTVKTGPKRLRWTRRDWSGSHGNGQARRWGSTDTNFKLAREAMRAGLRGPAKQHKFEYTDYDA